MRKVLLISLALLLAACGVVQPVQQEQPTPVIATVLVTVIPPTEVLPPTEAPLPTEAPTEVPTDVPAPTDIPQPTAAPADTSSSSSDLNPVNVDNILGKGVFSNIVFSNDLLTLRCVSREIEITMTAVHPDVTALKCSIGWWIRCFVPPIGIWLATFCPTAKVISPSPSKRRISTRITACLDRAWIDFQFAGVNRGGGVVDRTQRIEKLVEYYKECP
jgi:hypothetical protein